MAADQYTQIRNALFRDPRLSLKDKGLFGLISTHRDGWGVTPESLATCCTDGVSAIKTALRNLERHGYLRRDRERRKDGTLGSSAYYITDQPEAFMGADSESLPRSEPKVDRPPVVEPPQAEPPVDDRPHKKTNSNHTKGENTTSPLRPPMQLVPSAAEGKGGGGGDAPQQQEQDSAAAAFVDGLPYAGRRPGQARRRSLIARVSEAFTAGWNEGALRVQLTSETESAKSLAAVYAHRLEPAELPPPPRLPEPRTGEQEPPRAQKAKCPECHRPLRNSTEDALCTVCREDATA